MQKSIISSLLITMFFLSVSACSDNQTTTVIETPNPPIAEPSNTPIPTNTPTALSTPIPTNTPTHLPTDTITPTPIPAFSGTYLSKYTAEDHSSNGWDKEMVGDWVWDFVRTGDDTAKYKLTQTGVRVWEGEGTIVIDGDKMIILTTGNDIGSECMTEGSYTWTFDGSQLIFTLLSDSCTGRSLILTLHPVVLQP